MTALYHPRPERWPQFTLKGLLVALTLTGILTPCARWEHKRLQSRQRQPTDWELYVRSHVEASNPIPDPDRDHPRFRKSSD